MHLKKLFIIGTLLVSLVAFGATSAVDTLKTTTDQMLVALKQTQNRNSQALYSLVQRILLPHIDLDLMSEQVVGRDWAKASPAQRAEFKKQFTFFVTRTYSTALASYSNEKVRFFPIRGMAGNKVQVNSSIDQANGQSLAVSYRLILEQGQWKVYDFSVEGVSLVQNYRSQFVEILRTHGMAGLINQLKAHNAKLK
jgi:phospholipid transport system substrate-binding protein